MDFPKVKPLAPWSETIPGAPSRGSQAQVGRAALAEILKGLEPGWYTTAQLYPRYETWIRKQRRKPASMKVLGMGIRSMLGKGDTNSRRVEGGVMAWRLDPEHVNGKPVPDRKR